ncbi:MAG: 4-hydroxybenzoate octaprenyltransferase [Candidatus Berkiellales bacterium]
MLDLTSFKNNFKNQKWFHYLCLMRLHRPVGIWLLLWPTLMALWIAGAGSPSWRLVLVFTLGTIVMRSAGCVINDFADRKIDGFVQRTKLRPLVINTVTPREAIFLFIFLLVLSFWLLGMTNKMTMLLSLIAVLLATSYPFMKRYTYFPQVVLGAAYGWAIPMAFAAQSEKLPLICWLLFGASLLWTVAYDTQYAMVDREDDKKIGIKSTAILFGKYANAMIALLEVLALALLIKMGQIADLGVAFYLSLAIVTVLGFYQQWLTRNSEPSACFRAFLNNQWIGALLFVGVLLGY